MPANRRWSLSHRAARSPQTAHTEFHAGDEARCRVLSSSVPRAASLSNSHRQKGSRAPLPPSTFLLPLARLLYLTARGGCPLCFLVGGGSPSGAWCLHLGLLWAGSVLDCKDAAVGGMDADGPACSPCLGSHSGMCCPRYIQQWACPPRGGRKQPCCLKDFVSILPPLLQLYALYTQRLQHQLLQPCVSLWHLDVDSVTYALRSFPAPPCSAFTGCLERWRHRRIAGPTHHGGHQGKHALPLPLWAQAIWRCSPQCCGCCADDCQVLDATSAVGEARQHAAFLAACTL